MFLDKILNLISAFYRGKKYENIIMLGYNCEIAFRFYRQYKFVDSSLFAWSYVTFEQLQKALSDFETLGEKSLNYDFASHMFQCSQTGIYFHGKSPADAFSDNENENSKIIDNDRIELKSRLQYLKNKFKEYANNGKSTLYIIKINPHDAELSKQNCQQKIFWLFDFLKKYAQNDFTLLLVTEKSFYDKYLFDNPKIITRSVKKYSPDSVVTSKKEGDSFGWRLIFTEFRPKNKKKQKSKLKFELEN